MFSQDDKVNDVPKQAKVPIIDFERCREHFVDYLRNQTHVCYGRYQKGGVGSCNVKF